MWCSFGDRRSLLVLVKKCNEQAVSGSSSKDGQGVSGFGGCYWNPWLRELIVYFVPPFFAETFGWQSRLFDGQKPGKNSTGASATTKTINELRHILQPGFLLLLPKMMCSLTKTGDAKTHMEWDQRFRCSAMCNSSRPVEAYEIFAESVTNMQCSNMLLNISVH